MYKLNITLTDDEYDSLLALNSWTVVCSKNKKEKAMAALTKKLIDACAEVHVKPKGTK